MAIGNDEPTLDDKLGHKEIVLAVAERILTCDRPYVIGIGGTWGSGKTSFLRKVWAYLGGDFEPKPRGWQNREFPGITPAQMARMTDKDYKQNISDHLIWFNPWHHQFEANPAVALLHEIHKRLSWSDKAIHEMRKLGNVTMLTALNALGDLAKALSFDSIPSIKTDEIQKRGETWENEHFQSALTSERFRTVFEKTLTQIIGEEGRLIIFIDDLDRCEKELPFRLLEALKLYLSAGNCVFVLGLDRHHLEKSIAKELTGGDSGAQLAHAREYLGKMFQSYFVLPRPASLDAFLKDLLPTDPAFSSLLQRFGCTTNDRPNLLATLDKLLPHNPRKAKAFVNSWRLYLEVVDRQQRPVAAGTPPPPPLDWRITLILHYLGQYEEPLLRRLEEFPGFYSQIVSFCEGKKPKDKPLDLRFDGLELPLDLPTTNANEAFPIVTAPATEEAKKEEKAAASLPRTFYVAYLILEIESPSSPLTPSLDPATIRRHLPRAG